MDMLESVVGTRQGAAVQQLAAQFGLRPEQATAALGALMPALAAGLKRNTTTEGGTADLLSALSGGHHEAYLERPETLADPSTTADGNAILRHIFGSKDVSRQVAAGASRTTGIDTAVLKKMLPLAAAMAMGALAKRSNQTGAEAAAPSAAGGITSMLEPLLDRDRDGSMVDDVVGMIGGFLGRRG
jgi:hypothetical protein